MIHKKYLDRVGKVKIHPYTNGNQRGRILTQGKYAVLLVASLSEEKCNDDETNFDKEFIQKIKKNDSQPNLKPSSKHHQSEGWI